MSGHAVAEPTVYQAGIAVRAHDAEAVVFELPGCGCTGRDEAAVRALLPVVIAEHIAWLDQHGDVTRDAFPFEVEVSEVVDTSSFADEVADGEFLFAADRPAPGVDDVETALRRMAYARQDLLAVVRHLPDQVLDWLPPASAIRQDDWAPGVRSLRGILRHIAGSDSYYAGSVGAAPPERVNPGGAADLFEQRRLAVERLRSLTPADLSAEFKKRQPWQAAGYEFWTVTKALRRLISHERFHTREIEQRLAWLLMGAPELANAGLAAR